MKALLNKGHVRVRLALAVDWGARSQPAIAQRAGVEYDTAGVTLRRMTADGLLAHVGRRYELTAAGKRELQLLREALGIGAAA